jgi:hypothetical protein
LRVWCAWMHKAGYIRQNPAERLQLPRLGRHLPRNILISRRGRANHAPAEYKATRRAPRPSHSRTALLDWDSQARTDAAATPRPTSHSRAHLRT